METFVLAMLQFQTLRNAYLNFIATHLATKLQDVRIPIETFEGVMTISLCFPRLGRPGGPDVTINHYSTVLGKLHWRAQTLEQAIADAAIDLLDLMNLAELPPVPYCYKAGPRPTAIRQIETTTAGTENAAA
jgi:hypothetical protein